MQWKDRTSPLCGPTLLMVQLVFRNLPLLVVAVSSLLGRDLALVSTIESQYQARFRARATKTRAELSILAVQRSDERTYRVNVVPTGAGSLVQSVDVIVNCKSLSEILLEVQYCHDSLHSR